jgi:hypothetical protein
MRPILRTGGLALILVATAVQAQSDLPSGTWAIAKAPAEWRATIAHADLVVVSLHDALRRELTHALAQGGPAFAIQACHIDVAGLTGRMSGPGRISAGRTSDRLRNPANAPPAWAAPVVATSGVRRLARAHDGFVTDLGRSLGILRPILHQRMCDSCHGPADRVDPAVQAMLAVRYPGDRATGFVEGQLRGWFWVEVPKRPE